MSITDTQSQSATDSRRKPHTTRHNPHNVGLVRPRDIELYLARVDETRVDLADTVGVAPSTITRAETDLGSVRYGIVRRLVEAVAEAGVEYVVEPLPTQSEVRAFRILYQQTQDTVSEESGICSSTLRRIETDLDKVSYRHVDALVRFYRGDSE